jgi:hypothetical protein
MRRRMQRGQLKSLIEAGTYKCEPALIAEAMLQHRGLRSLLIEAPAPTGPLNGAATGPLNGAPLNPAGQTPPTPEAGRQAAA